MRSADATRNCFARIDGAGGFEDIDAEQEIGSAVGDVAGRGVGGSEEGFRVGV